MKINSTQLRHLIREILYRASAPKRYGLPDVEVDADDTRDAGRRASLKYRDEHGAVGIDPFSIDVREAPSAQGKPTSLKQYLIDLFAGRAIDISDNENNITPLDYEDYEWSMVNDDLKRRFGISSDDGVWIIKYIRKTLAHVLPHPGAVSIGDLNNTPEVQDAIERILSAQTVAHK